MVGRKPAALTVQQCIVDGRQQWQLRAATVQTVHQYRGSCCIAVSAQHSIAGEALLVDGWQKDAKCSPLVA